MIPNVKLSSLFVVLFGMLTILAAVQPASAIVIDGHVRDWDSVRGLPIPSSSKAYASQFGKIDEMKVSQDDDFIYVYLRFAVPRPFTTTGRQADLAPGVWDDFSYVELDRDGDGRWDFSTRMVTGKRVGINNLAILGRVPRQDAGQIVLAAEGHKDYRPLGPRAFFSSDSQSVELRIPRLPLRLQSGVVYIRAKVSYRDDRSGSKDWVSRYHPDGDGWIALELRPIAGRGENYQSDSPARRIEPVISRTQFEREVGPRYARYRGAYTYPWREIGPSTEVGTRADDLLDSAGSDGGDAAGSPARSIMVISPDGQVRQGAPSTSSNDPEEGQGVPGELEAGGDGVGNQVDIDE